MPASNEQNSQDKLVHFCNGGSGAVSMLIKAFEMFQDPKYIEAALNCGEAIWNRGLVLKGPGLCHGITGNIYPFLALAEFTKNLKWKMRAYQFAVLSFNKEVMNFVKGADDD